MGNEPDGTESLDRIRDEAADWFARLRADDVCEADLRAFDEWLGAHSAAMEAFLEIWNLWGRTAVLEDPVAGEVDRITRIRYRARP